MSLLDEKIQAQVKEILQPITQPIELVVFTKSALVLPGQDEPGLQQETVELLKEIASLS